MKQLYLLRHAKSDWGSLTRSDHDRHLNDRGTDAALKMAHFLVAQLKNQPQPRQNQLYIFCSTATRAMETVKPLIDACDQAGLAYTITYDEKLYLACAETLMIAIQQLPDHINNGLFVGHNPGFEDLALCLTENRDHPAYAKIEEKYVTAGLCRFENPHATWHLADEKSLILKDYIKPKSL